MVLLGVGRQPAGNGWEDARTRTHTTIMDLHAPFREITSHDASIAAGTGHRGRAAQAIGGGANPAARRGAVRTRLRARCAYDRGCDDGRNGLVGAWTRLSRAARPPHAELYAEALVSSSAGDFLTPDRIALLYEVAEGVQDLRGGTETEQTLAVADRLGLSGPETAAVLTRIDQGLLPPLGTVIRGGTNEIAVLSAGGVDVAVRREQASATTASEPLTWSPAETLELLFPQLAEIDRREHEHAAGRGAPTPLHVHTPQLLHASQGRQIIRWIPGAHPSVNSGTRAHDFFFLGVVPELMARFAQVTRYPRYRPGTGPPNNAAEAAHSQVATHQAELDQLWPTTGAVYRELGIPRRLDRLHEKVDRFHDRPMVVVHGDIGPANVRIHGNTVTALDIDLARLDDWVPELAWVMAKKGSPRVMAACVTRRLRGWGVWTPRSCAAFGTTCRGHSGCSRCPSPSAASAH
ncbi:hypothetical protein LO772_33270 [Yinghuangia sp. ASG 101]|uniref:phosphotransferase n=1 Tax=Yinghuangia sp. ASG 101 TaxID=2896848 RepID=UPI001E6105F9|nr:phosphotransferase [Yinghuangia sp. ASG 101]UGQ11591.1 hypothetical protein LO772_33270 [Yinghuangia sp. ASG 101]